jgi:uncharacterized protein
MRYGWDPQKNAANIAKHGFDFRDTPGIFGGPVVVQPDRRKDYGEQRYAAIGTFEGICFTVIYTDREEERRVISVRRSNRKEGRVYEDAFGLAHRLGSNPADDGRRD